MSPCESVLLRLGARLVPVATGVLVVLPAVGGLALRPGGDAALVPLEQELLGVLQVGARAGRVLLGGLTCLLDPLYEPRAHPGPAEGVLGKVEHPPDDGEGGDGDDEEGD